MKILSAVNLGRTLRSEITKSRTLRIPVIPILKAKRCSRGILIFAGCLIFTHDGLPQTTADVGTSATARDAPVLLPKMTVTGETMKNFPLIPKADIIPADLTGPYPQLFFPGRAYFEGVFDGQATVGVMLDVRGNPTDFLLLRYTQRYFGDALLREARRQAFTPNRVKGVAVPGRYYFGYIFKPGFVVAMSSFDAITERTNEIAGGTKFIYEPHPEREIDGGLLECTESAVPFIPDGYEAPNSGPVKVLVTFYVDEKGHVRLPSVESAASPLLIPNAVKAALHWAFTPPTIKGKPVIVFAMRAVTLEAYTPAPAPPSATTPPR